MAKKAGNKAEQLKQGDMVAYEEKQKLTILLHSLKVAYDKYLVKVNQDVTKSTSESVSYPVR